MLVVVHNRNIQSFFESFLYVETFGRFDIFKIDTSKCWGYSLYSFAELFRILFRHFDVKNVDTSIYLKEQSFTFHHGLAAHGSYVAKAKYGSAITDNGYQVAFVCIFVHGIRVALNLQAGIGHAGRIS